ncbi:MAG: metalloregulator ArsR/SmtB family transcription factor [Alphaproteobacteria bacterium]
MASPQQAPRDEDEEARLDAIFHALANRTRRAMLRQLAKGPAMVTELAAPFDMSLPSASKNLKVLEKAGLIDRTVSGRVHRCALDPESLRDADAWLEFYRGFWSGSLDSLARFVAEEDNPDDQKCSKQHRSKTK